MLPNDNQAIAVEVDFDDERGLRSNPSAETAEKVFCAEWLRK
jgi:hypothetical protein